MRSWTVGALFTLVFTLAITTSAFANGFTELTEESAPGQISAVEGKLVVLFFTAEWAGPAKMVTPHLKEVCEALSEKAVCMRINIDDAPGVSAKYGIRNVPTILIIKDGEVVDRIIGMVPKDEIKARLEAQL